MPHRPSRLVAILGRGVVDDGSDPSRPWVGADDLGFTRGDGCFDATRVVTDFDGRHRIDQLDRHLARFARSHALLELPAPDLTAWSDLVTQALAAWRVPGEAFLRIIATRGPELVPGPPAGLLLLSPIPAAILAQRDGVAAVTLSRGYASDAFADRPWLLGGAKTLSYAGNLAAKREAVRRGAGDAIFVSTDGFVLEAPQAAVVAHRGGELSTTPVEGTGVLESITQQVIFEQAATEGLSTRDALMTPADLHDADGVWLVSSVRGVVPVLRLDGVRLADNPQVDAALRRLAGYPVRDPAGTWAGM